MDWKQAIEEERAALTRIVALLHALAGLAELAGRHSPAVRGFVLWVLRHAEAVARDFVAGPDTRLALMPPAGSCPADAARLAVSLRALARQLNRQARLLPAVRGEDGGETQTLSLRRMPAMRDVANALCMCAALAWRIPHPAPDTS